MAAIAETVVPDAAGRPASSLIEAARAFFDRSGGNATARSLSSPDALPFTGTLGFFLSERQ